MRRRGGSQSQLADRRGQASVVGVTLLFGITLIGVTAILVIGSTALTSGQDNAEVDRAELAMTQFDSRVALVALGDADRQRTSIELSGRGSGLRIDENAGWMNVSVVNGTDVEDVILNTTMGAVVFENGDVRIAYQGGGVWRKQSGGSVMVSPPEFHYRTTGGQDPTLTLPLVIVRGTGSVSSDFLIEKVGTEAKYPIDDDSSRSNPLTDGEIVITVHSEYYQGWGAFFETRTGGSVVYDHDNDTVTITLSVTGSSPAVEGGIVSGASGDELEFKNKAEADSYDSTIGPYSASNNESTKIVAAGDVELNNQAKLWGDLEAGGAVTLDNKANITGNLSYGATLSMDNGAVVMGTISNDADVDPLDPVDWLIDDKRDEFESANDNDDNDDVDSATNTLIGCDSVCELNATGGDGEGQYYLEKIELDDGDELVVNTSKGEVEVVVLGDMTLENDAKMRVTDPGNPARFYLERDFDLKNEANVTVPDDRSPGLWVYMNPGSDAEIVNQAKFIGVIYGPGSGAQSGVTIELGNKARIFGGLVGNVPSVQNDIGLHFDAALASEDPLGGTGAGKPPLTYLHITVNEVNVTAG